MKKLGMLLMLLMAMTMGYHVSAQSVTMPLMPGWNWISCPTMDTLDFETAMGSFTPAVGDVIKSRWGQATYINGQWRGSISEFYPGYGYHYKSNRTMPVMLTFNAQQPAPQVVVTTLDPMSITAISAMGGGEVTVNDGTYIIVKGICWGINPNPTTNDSFYQEAGSGVGSFSISMTDLNLSTTYYVRAYAVTANGTVYGEQESFTTRNGIPTMTTADVTDIEYFSATSGGTITDDGGLDITAYGVCWSTSPNPTIIDSHTNDGTGTGSFSSNIAGLSRNTTYYVRAYATNSNMTLYGNAISFTTLSDAPTGAIDGLFSVSDSTQVFFSQGNLQYIGSAMTPYWKFADQQWDYFGTTTGQNSSDVNVDRDLFGWGTSGWDCGNTYYQPWDTDNSNASLYGPPIPNYQEPNYPPGYEYIIYSLTGSYANSDWGVYNTISNGGNQANQWRTLTYYEWKYVFNYRNTSSGIRYAKAQVNNVNSLILLPDDWNPSYYALNNTNESSADFGTNIITSTQWIALEQHGAVLLPAAGCRNGASITSEDAFYWQATGGRDKYFSVMHFGSSYVLFSGSYNAFAGLSVRLVSDAE